MDNPENYSKAANTATVCLYSLKDDAFMFVERSNEPYKGQLAFPGGFMDAYKENIYTTGIREVKEETGLDLFENQMKLIDIRSNPDRDPRDHVIDVGFFAIIENFDNAKAGDDAAKLIQVKLKDVLNTPLAFDHMEILEKVIDVTPRFWFLKGEQQKLSI